MQNNLGLFQHYQPNPQESIIPPNDQNMNYYQEYCKLFIANVVLTNQMKELIAEKNELLARIAELEVSWNIKKSNFVRKEEINLRRLLSVLEI